MQKRVKSVNATAMRANNDDSKKGKEEEKEVIDIQPTCGSVVAPVLP